MRKIFAGILAALCLCFCLALTACNEEPTPTPDEPGKPSDDPTQATTTLPGEKKGEVYYTADPGGNTTEVEWNERLPGETLRQ